MFCEVLLQTQLMIKNGVQAEMTWANVCLLDGTAGRFVLITLGRDLHRNVCHAGLFSLTAAFAQ